MFKKLMTMFFALLLLVSFLPSVVGKADDVERNVIYAQLPADWENPCVWAWNEDGTNAFDAWPGEAMDADDANAGWYYIYVPSYANHVILNANDGNVQTEEIVLDEGKNAWVTVNADLSSAVSYDAQTQGDAPAYVEKFAVHVKAADSFGAATLNATGDDNSLTNVALSKGDSDWATTKIPTWTQSISIASEDGSTVTDEIAIDAAEVWITVNEDGTTEYSYIDPDKAAVADVSVHVQVPADWENPCLWAWSAPDGTNAYATWPGEAFEEGENGWYTRTMPGWVNSVIVNANDGSVQTADLSIETEKEIWIVVTSADEAEVYYEEPDVEETALVSAEPSTEDGDQDSNSSNMVVPIVIVLVVIVAVVAVVLVVKKKKN